MAVDKIKDDNKRSPSTPSPSTTAHHSRRSCSSRNNNSSSSSTSATAAAGSPLSVKPKTGAPGTTGKRKAATMSNSSDNGCDKTKMKQHSDTNTNTNKGGGGGAVKSWAKSMFNTSNPPSSPSSPTPTLVINNNDPHHQAGKESDADYHQKSKPLSSHLMESPSPNDSTTYLTSTSAASTTIGNLRKSLTNAFPSATSSSDNNNHQNSTDEGVIQDAGTAGSRRRDDDERGDREGDGGNYSLKRNKSFSYNDLTPKIAPKLKLKSFAQSTFSLLPRPAFPKLSVSLGKLHKLTSLIGTPTIGGSGAGILGHKNPPVGFGHHPSARSTSKMILEESTAWSQSNSSSDPTSPTAIPKLTSDNHLLSSVDHSSRKKDASGGSAESLVSDEGCYSGPSSIFKSTSSSTNEYGRRNSISDYTTGVGGGGRVGSHNYHHVSSLNRFTAGASTTTNNRRSNNKGRWKLGGMPSWTSSSTTPKQRPSLTSLRTYYAFGAKSWSHGMPSVDKWARSKQQSTKSWVSSVTSSAAGIGLSSGATPMATKSYSSFSTASSSPYSPRISSSNTPSNGRYLHFTPFVEKSSVQMDPKQPASPHFSETANSVSAKPSGDAKQIKPVPDEYGPAESSESKTKKTAADSIGKGMVDKRDDEHNAASPASHTHLAGTTETMIGTGNSNDQKCDDSEENDRGKDVMTAAENGNGSGKPKLSSNRKQWEKLSRLASAVAPPFALLNASVSSLLTTMKTHLTKLTSQLHTKKQHIEKLEKEKTMMKEKGDVMATESSKMEHQVMDLVANNQKLSLENEILKQKLEETQLMVREEPKLKAMEEHIVHLQNILRQREIEAQSLPQVIIEPSEGEDLSGQLEVANSQILNLSVLKQKLEGDMAQLQDEMNSALNELDSKGPTLAGHQTRIS